MISYDNELKKYFRRVDLVASKSNNKYMFNNQDKIAYTIHTVVFQNFVEGDIKKAETGILNYKSYHNLMPSFFKFPYYVSLVNLDDEMTKNLISQIRKENEEAPTLVTNLLKLENDNNILYRYTAYVSLDNFYEVVINNKLYLNKNDNPTICIYYFDENDLAKLKVIQKYMIENYPDNHLSYRVNIASYRSLMSFNKIINVIGRDNISLFLDNELFAPSELNPLSAKSLIKKPHPIKNLLLGKNSKIHYLGAIYNNLEDIVELEKVFDVILSCIPTRASDLEKVTYITLFIINYFNYDYETPKLIRSLYEVLNKQLGVCRDFAYLFKLLMDRLAINCKIIKVFEKIDGEISGHVFNVVQIDSEYYFIDVTYLINEIKDLKVINSLDESINFLTDNKTFNEFHKQCPELEKYQCSTMSKARIENAITNVSTWKNNYFINNSLKKLFKKPQEIINEHDVMAAIPIRKRR